jgi:hypothetical protein
LEQVPTSRRGTFGDVRSSTSLTDRSNAYSDEFLAAISPGSLRSARTILRELFDMFQPTSVLDVGCGDGASLAAAKALGASELSGIDGPWVNADRLRTEGLEFRNVALESTFSSARKLISASASKWQSIFHPAVPNDSSRRCARRLISYCSAPRSPHKAALRT